MDICCNFLPELVDRGIITGEVSPPKSVWVFHEPIRLYVCDEDDFYGACSLYRRIMLYKNFNYFRA
jgi:hypothetical protein